MKSQSYIIGQLYSCYANCESYYNYLNGNKCGSVITFSMMEKFINNTPLAWNSLMHRIEHIFKNRKVCMSYGYRNMEEVKNDLFSVYANGPKHLDVYEFEKGRYDMDVKIHNQIKESGNGTSNGSKDQGNS